MLGLMCESQSWVQLEAITKLPLTWVLFEFQSYRDVDVETMSCWVI